MFRDWSDKEDELYNATEDFRFWEFAKSESKSKRKIKVDPVIMKVYGAIKAQGVRAEMILYRTIKEGLQDD